MITSFSYPVMEQEVYIKYFSFIPNYELIVWRKGTCVITLQTKPAAFVMEYYFYIKEYPTDIL